MSETEGRFGNHPHGFAPAKSKLEAVVRISQLTNSGPEELGPGSKERKSVLVNLAQGLTLRVDTSLSKPELGAEIATALGVAWTSDCWSAGQTITLAGLNLLLHAGWTRLENSPSPAQSLTLEEEVRQISQVVLDATPETMIGQEAIAEMKEGGCTNWKQTEWQGWFFEHRARNALFAQLGGEPVTFGQTEFDYHLNRTWDLKTHSTVRNSSPPKRNNFCWLNDKESTDDLVRSEGLGLIVLSGLPTYDEEFTAWHREMRGAGPSTSTNPKVLKSRFDAERLDLFFIPNINELRKALESGQLGVINQGRNSNNAPRPPKYQANLLKCLESDIQVFSHEY